jgi:peptidylprolyl isomerase
MFDSSVKRNQAFSFEVGANQVIKGWDEGVALMKEGDKFRFIIPYTLAYGENGRPPQIPAKSDLIFDVELISVTSIKQIEPYNATGKDTIKTASGLKYIVIEKGTGTKATSGAKIKVHYTGFFDNGKIFDSSVKRGEPIEFVVGKGQVIKGWDEGLQLMQVGDKFKFFIPYQLGYGEEGYLGAIPPKSNLTFDVELVEVKSL